VVLVAVMPSLCCCEPHDHLAAGGGGGDVSSLVAGWLGLLHTACSGSILCRPAMCTCSSPGQDSGMHSTLVRLISAASAVAACPAGGNTVNLTMHEVQPGGPVYRDYLLQVRWRRWPHAAGHMQLATCSCHVMQCSVRQSICLAAGGGTPVSPGCSQAAHCCLVARSTRIIPPATCMLQGTTWCSPAARQPGSHSHLFTAIPRPPHHLLPPQGSQQLDLLFESWLLQRVDEPVFHSWAASCPGDYISFSAQWEVAKRSFEGTSEQVG
jgi:hypothetical protein